MLFLSLTSAYSTPSSEPEPLSATGVDDTDSYALGFAVTANCYLQCNASGGTPPYSYSWSYLSGDAGTIVSGESSDTVQIRYNDVDPGETFVGVYRCTVTDANSNTVTADATATAENTGA